MMSLLTELRRIWDSSGYKDAAPTGWPFISRVLSIVHSLGHSIIFAATCIPAGREIPRWH
jgi:hypothetical protein